jgi:hypothetical protein
MKIMRTQSGDRIKTAPKTAPRTRHTNKFTLFCKNKLQVHLQNNLGHQTDHLRDLVRLTVAALLTRLKQEVEVLEEKEVKKQVLEDSC